MEKTRLFNDETFFREIMTIIASIMSTSAVNYETIASLEKMLHKLIEKNKTLKEKIENLNDIVKKQQDRIDSLQNHILKIIT